MLLLQPASPLVNRPRITLERWQAGGSFQESQGGGLRAGHQGGSAEAQQGDWLHEESRSPCYGQEESR